MWLKSCWILHLRDFNHMEIFLWVYMRVNNFKWKKNNFLLFFTARDFHTKFFYDPSTFHTKFILTTLSLLLQLSLFLSSFSTYVSPTYITTWIVYNKGRDNFWFETDSNFVLLAFFSIILLFLGLLEIDGWIVWLLGPWIFWFPMFVERETLVQIV